MRCFSGNSKSKLFAALVLATSVSFGINSTISSAAEALAAGNMNTVAITADTNRFDLAKQVLDRWQPIATAAGQSAETWREVFATQFGLMDAQTLGTIAAVRVESGYAGFSQAIRNAGMKAYLAAQSGKVSTKALGGNVFIPIVPCRLVDTRLVGGPIAAGTTRNFFYYTNTAAFNFGTFQGGAAGAAGTVCPGTFFPDNAPQFTAVAMTVTVVSPTAAGNFIIWGGASPIPTASALNWTGPGEILANTTVVPGGGRSGSGPGGGLLDFAVNYNGPTGSAQLVADVVGYYVSNTAQVLDCITVQLDGVGTANVPNNTEVDFSTGAACAAGYDGASISCQYSGSSPAGLALTQVGPPPPSAFFACIWRNQSGLTLDKSRFFTTTSCCRLPGR